jgi:hypothetical protein
LATCSSIAIRFGLGRRMCLYANVWRLRFSLPIECITLRYRSAIEIVKPIAISRSMVKFRHFLVEDSYFNILKLFRALTLYVLMFTAMSVFLCFMCAIPIPWDFASSLFLQYTAVAILGGLFGGLAIGFSHWRTWEKFYAQTLAHQRKFDAPPVRLEIDKPYVC